MTDLALQWASVPQITCLRASADGAWAFWVWSGLTETDEVYAAPTDGTAAPERLTYGQDHFSIRDVSPDGSRLILAQSISANEHDHLFVLDRAANNRLTQLTPTQNTHYLYGGSFTPDGRAVVFVADHDYATGQTTPGGWVWHQDLASGTRTVLAKSSTPFERGISFGPSGNEILWHRHEHAPAGTQLWLMAADGSNLRQVLNFGPTNNTRGDWISDDQIAFVTDHQGRDATGILTLSTGHIDWLASEPALYPHEIIAGQGTFVCIAHDASRSHATLWNGHLRPLPNPTNRRSLLPHAALPDGGWLAEAYDADAPHQLVRLHPGGTATPIATPTANPALHFTTPRDYRWHAPDGTACQGWLYTPNGPSKGLITYVHGGPTWHSEDWVNPKIGYWVQLGYTVLDPNYRGSTGFGMAYREAVKTDGWGGREQSDIRAGIQSLVNDTLAQIGKIAVTGNSYGGFSSWIAITRHADLVTAAMPMCGMYRLDIDYNETEMPHGRAYSQEMMGGTPDQFPEKYANASPGNFIHLIKGHLLIVHGLADSNVGPENTHAALRELTAAGIPHDALLFDNEGHGIARRTNLARYLARTETFLNHAFTTP
ncbi:MAG: prolyl oligopeptidase family serine peptidase [Paracoccaceae bacterium]